MSKVLYISSEAYPLIKTGGLGDVAGSLPRALLKNNQDVRLFLPAYPDVIQRSKHIKKIAQKTLNGHKVELLQSRLPGTRVKTWLVNCPPVFDRPGNPYLNQKGEPWPDNALRFALFSQMAAQVALGQCQLNWQPDVVHCNDWQSALVPALLHGHSGRPATVFTIHNLAYQGLFPKKTFNDLDLPDELWHMDALEFHDQLSFIKGGLVYADRINTVSPRYAEEIQHSKFGYGLDGLLTYRKKKLSGIINGIDNEVWNPGSDQYLPYTYNRRSLTNKQKNKTDLQSQLGLPVDESLPLLGMVSRLVEQKGLKSILQAMDKLVKLPLQIVFLGTGDHHYEKLLSGYAKRYPDKLAVIIGYNEALSHHIEAAADIYLMPSTFEPCGLNQLYSLRYGTLPVARDVGGLADTVINTTKASIKNKTANGFIVEKDSAASLLKSVKTALSYYTDKGTWKQLQLNAMTPDYSWQESAQQYMQLYHLALSDCSKIN